MDPPYAQRDFRGGDIPQRCRPDAVGPQKGDDVLTAPRPLPPGIAGVDCCRLDQRVDRFADRLERGVAGFVPETRSGLLDADARTVTDVVLGRLDGVVVVLRTLGPLVEREVREGRLAAEPLGDGLGEAPERDRARRDDVRESSALAQPIRTPSAF